MSVTESHHVVSAFRRGFVVGAAVRFPLALLQEARTGKLDAAALIGALKLAAQSGLIIGGWSGLYKLIRLVLRVITKKDGGVVPLFIAGGLSGQVLWSLSPGAYFEIYLYFLKFLVEGLVNAAQKQGVNAPANLQRLSVFLLMGLTAVLFEKDPSSLNARLSKLLGFLWA